MAPKTDRDLRKQRWRACDLAPDRKRIAEVMPMETPGTAHVAPRDKAVRPRQNQISPDEVERIAI